VSPLSWFKQQPRCFIALPVVCGRFTDDDRALNEFACNPKQLQQ
jgi:hypothetical protein